jgi:hypothetical protein
MRIFYIMKAEYTKDNVICALEEVVNGKSVRKALLEWSVLRSTLQDRNTTTQSCQEGTSHLQRLPTVIENRLTT